MHTPKLQAVVALLMLVLTANGCAAPAKDEASPTAPGGTPRKDDPPAGETVVDSDYVDHVTVWDPEHPGHAKDSYDVISYRSDDATCYFSESVTVNSSWAESDSLKCYRGSTEIKYFKVHYKTSDVRKMKITIRRDTDAATKPTTKP